MSTLKRLEERLLRRLFSVVIDGPLSTVPGLVSLYTRLYSASDVELRTSVDGQTLAPAVMPDGWLLYYTDGNERDVRAIFSSLVTDGSFVVDVGASIGPFTLVAAETVGSDGRVLAFKPNPARFAGLQHNVALNEAANVTCSNDAVGAECAESEIPIDDSGAFTESRGTLVRTTTLDERLSESPDVVKIDVEGGEFDVLRGMTRILTEASPDILIEMHPEFVLDFASMARECEATLADLGFQFYRIRPSATLQKTDSFLGERAHYLLTKDDPPETPDQTI